MRRLFQKAMVICLLSFTGGMASGADMNYIVLTGAQLKASAVALEHFSRLPEGPNLIKFSVYVGGDNDNHEIIFAPVRTKEDPGRGGVAAAGREVHYFVSKENFVVVRKSFSR